MGSQCPTINKKYKNEQNHEDNKNKNEQNHEEGENEKDFNYSILKDLIPKKEENNKDNKNIILLTTGSYNPIHRMHLEILNIAYKKLLSYGNYNVICGFISPSADCYVRHKAKEFIDFKTRCDMIKEAIKEYNELGKEDNKLKIFLHKWEGSHQYFIDFPEVNSQIQNQINEHFKQEEIQLVYVCGMDLYLKCARHYLGKNVIAVDRKPYKKNFFNEKPTQLIFEIKDEKAEPFSSTSIREYYYNNQFDQIEKVTFPGVAKMVIDYYDKYYKNDKNSNFEHP